ncbi:MAG: phosphate acyltransferase PlsX [Acidobacteriota bacterium]|uniref:Phosphate acyltransferase n=2 Tax=Thermoanaerobaculum aquaticum TaxID=1312852 RepID=A0A062XQB9_9BACT|nr:phosphate acyltransferase PlsX [Thermoanaerobaculum aquaticum]KDA52973.1 phosphate acyltransferase [Thermoanaerobaculum aquaticum]BCW94260.1 MAG: phosphate acyltransferase [Thermoanaerobaculum sp.]
MKRLPVALDAMGGDHAPQATVQGAVEAAREYGLEVFLVGKENLLRKELARFGTVRGVHVVDAPEVVSMDDPPIAPVRQKKESSMAVALRLVRDGLAGAFVSAGNTGAAMVAAKLILGTLAGVDRPALAAPVPNISGQTLLIDAGANVDCKPRHLLEFAVMGHFYSHLVFGIPSPRVGLLSNGEEEGKGDKVTVAAYELLADAKLGFVGNVEGRDIFAGTVDVVACDGFVGNVVLKTAEGLGEMVVRLLRQEAKRMPISALGFLLAKGALSSFKKRVDYAEYGGAPLLGVRGAVLIGHGRSNPKAIRSAIRFAHRFASSGAVAAIEERVSRLNHEANGG